jgi:ABC-type transport system involved in cytochrome c biogenesis permease subunit
MTRLDRFFPVAVVVVCGGWFLSRAVPPSPGPDGVDVVAVGRLPVREGGRIMPLDSVARSSLQAISGRTEVQDEHGTVLASAVEWLAQVMTAPGWDSGPAAKLPIFRIDNDQLLAALELPRRPGFYRYSPEEVLRSLDKLEDEFKRIDEKKEKGRPLDLYDAKIEDLSRKLHRYRQLARNQLPQAVPPQTDSEDWVTLASVDQQYLQKATEADITEAQNRAIAALQANLIRQFGALNNVPPEMAAKLRGMFQQQVGQEMMLMAREHRAELNPAAGALTRVLKAAADKNGQHCAAALTEYQGKYLGRVPTDERADAALEADVLGQMAPFYHAAFLYLFVLVLTAFGWLVWTGPLNRAAFMLGVFTFGMHTTALVLRMYLQGRPPVTNLYASAVFIGWGAAGLCLLLERIFRNGIGNFAAGVSGAATLGVAHFLSGSGDTMAMLVAVLDTNFWLATHVTTVTLGYTATFVAGLIGIVYIVRGVFTPSLTPETEKSLAQMIYGVVCFATLLSFIGTILGGIWADYSWGRFWGWDPKENGAVMIVIWNCLILHARWSGLVRNRGVALLAVFGNIITAWSWFGTNQLQIGLHSYGFDNRLATGCRWFWISQLVIIGVGLIPQRYWVSAPHRRPAPAAPTRATEQPAAASAVAPPQEVNGHQNGHAPKAGKGKKAGKRR